MTDQKKHDAADTSDWEAKGRAAEQHERAAKRTQIRDVLKRHGVPAEKLDAAAADVADIVWGT